MRRDARSRDPAIRSSDVVTRHVSSRGARNGGSSASGWRGQELGAEEDIRKDSTDALRSCIDRIPPWIRHRRGLDPAGRVDLTLPFPIPIAIPAGSYFRRPLDGRVTPPRLCPSPKHHGPRARARRYRATTSEISRGGIFTAIPFPTFPLIEHRPKRWTVARPNPLNSRIRDSVLFHGALTTSRVPSRARTQARPPPAIN